MANVFSQHNGMTLTGNSTASLVEITYGFRWVPLNGGNVSPQTEEVTVQFAPSATQTQFRNAVRAQLLAWAAANGHTIQRHLLEDGTLVVP